MQRRSLTMFTTLFLTCGMSMFACGGGEPGTTVETTTESTGGATTSGTTGEPTTSTTSGTTTDTPTGEPATTTGESDSGTGTTGTTGGSTTGDSTGPVTSDTTTDASTTEQTGTSTGTGTTGETGESTGGAGEPVSFAECQDGMADSCPELDPACLVVDGPGGFGPNGSFFVIWSYCTRECESDADCVSGLPGGSAKPRCLPKGANDIKVCVLDCSFGKTCPEGLECSYDDACGTKFCDCSGDGCQDDLCV